MFKIQIQNLLRLPSSLRQIGFANRSVYSPSQFGRMVSTLPRLAIFEAIKKHDPLSTAIVHSVSARTFTYGDLLRDVAEARDRLRKERGGDVAGERIAFLVENCYDYVVTLLSALAANAIALPLSPAFPAHELQYIMDHSQASMLLTSKKFEAKAEDVLKEGLKIQPKLVRLEKKLGGEEHEEVELEESTQAEGGMMLYTSGTTNRPKGVLLPLSVMTAQSQSLQTAWNYSPEDRLLHVLPLHHIHGTINAIMTPLLAGSSIEFIFPFNPTAIWNRFAAPFLSPPTIPSKITFFTVVPTVYNRLLTAFPDLSPEQQTAAKLAISPANLRINISGSAALPTPTKKKWADLSNGNVLLERYGMTEVGMALSCGLANEDRVDASVGWPLPSVEVRLVDTDTHEVIVPGQELSSDGKERHGEIQLRGPTLFKEYWDNPAATAKELVEGEDGKGLWFKTGDVAVRREVPSAGHSDQAWAKGPMYFILGRLSADIIKSGGEKVSALEVEREILSLPQVAECAVVAVPSGKWGHKVGVVVMLTEVGQTAGRNGGKWGPLDMRKALRDKIAAYKIPQIMKVVDVIPRNAMGKINKKLLVEDVFAAEHSGDEM